MQTELSENPVLIFDAHLDLSMNALEWNRDLRSPVARIRERESEQNDKIDRAHGTVAFPEMRRGRVGICVATLIARFVKPGNPLPGWASAEQAWAQTQGQLSWYRAMEQAGELVQISDFQSLRKHLAPWSGPHTASDASLAPSSDAAGARPPIGYILSLEGADSILTPGHLEAAYRNGLRALGPAHYGPGTYAHGTNSEGGLGPHGRELLAEMQRLNVILDVTHLSDESFRESLDSFTGSIWASHSNCRALVPHNRQFSDEQLLLLIERGAVIGACLDAWMMIPNWIRAKTTPASSGLLLERLIDHIDHICQLAGNARHCGIGSDLDGGFGIEQTPSDLDTIADLQKIPGLLARRGYNESDVQGIAHGNFIRFLEREWAPAAPSAG